MGPKIDPHKVWLEDEDPQGPPEPSASPQVETGIPMTLLPIAVGKDGGKTDMKYWDEQILILHVTYKYICIYIYIIHLYIVYTHHDINIWNRHT